MSSAGSPRMRQLPVEDAAQSVGPDQEVAHPVVAVHRHLRPARWAVGRQPAHAELERGADLAQRIEERAGDHPAGRPAAGPRRWPGRWCGWRPARARPGRSGRGRAAAHSASRRILRGMVSPSKRSTTSQLAPSSLAVAERHDRGHRHAGRRRGAQQRGLHPDPALLRALAAVHLQDERPRPAVGVQARRRW